MFNLRYIILLLGLQLPQLVLTCYTPFNAHGGRMHVSDCAPIMELLRQYQLNVPPVQSRFIYLSFKNEEDRRNRTVCCQNEMNVTQAFESVGAEMLLNLKEQCGDNMRKRISFGLESTFMAYPWSALLIYDTEQRFHCGGTLITNRYVLTAAHCVNQPHLPLIGVRLREHNITSDVDCEEDTGGILRCASPVLDVSIEKSIIHPNYSTTTFDNDIALLRLDRIIEFERTLRPICLPEYQGQKFDKNYGVISGWGATERSTVSEVLMEADVPIFNVSHCQSIYRRRVLDDTKICASGVNGVDTCKGDSGGPLFLRMEGYNDGRKFRYLQAGITSLGLRTCGEKRHFPEIFTRVAKYVDWIARSLEL